MYRLVRKIRARVKSRELILLSGAFAIAFAFGGIGVKWYRDSGRENRLVASINDFGGYRYGADSAETETGAEIEQIAFDLFTSSDEDAFSGFYSSPRAKLLQPATGHQASYMSMLQVDAAAQPPDAETSDNQDELFDAQDEAYQNIDAGDPGESAEAEPESEELSGTEADNGASKYSSDIPQGPLYTVKVIYFGERHVIETVGKKVSDLFDEKGFAVSKEDKITGAYLDGIINSDLYIEIKRVTQKTVVEDIKIPAKTVYRENFEIQNGKSKVIRSAADGKKRVEYLLTYENGIQTSKKVVKEEILSEAVSGIIELGSSGTRKGKGGVEFTYTKVIDVKCTAYSNSFEDTGKRPGDPAYGITKNGMVAREGVVAVDPSVIPLGTKMYIEILDDKIEDYGIAIAGDTGSKIIGKKVDLFFNATRDELLQFGVRKAKVYIID